MPSRFTGRPARIVGLPPRERLARDRPPANRAGFPRRSAASSGPGACPAQALRRSGNGLHGAASSSRLPDRRRIAPVLARLSYYGVEMRRDRRQPDQRRIAPILVRPSYHGIETRRDGRRAARERFSVAPGSTSGPDGRPVRGPFAASTQRRSKTPSGANDRSIARLPPTEGGRSISSPPLFPLSATNHSENRGRAPLPVGTCTAPMGRRSRPRSGSLLGRGGAGLWAIDGQLPRPPARQYQRRTEESWIDPRRGAVRGRGVYFLVGQKQEGPRALSAFFPKRRSGAKTALLRNARMTSARLSMTTRWPERGGRVVVFVCYGG